MLFNTVFMLAAVAIMFLMFMGFAMKSLGDPINKPAIYYPNAPEIKVMVIPQGRPPTLPTSRFRSAGFPPRRPARSPAPWP